jgi:hypothetical protein
MWILALSVMTISVALLNSNECDLRLLPTSSAAKVWGGQTQAPMCRQTNTTCPDPTNLPASCTKVGNGCQQCKMTVPNWSSCVPGNGSQTCTQNLPANNPYCGEYYSGLTNMQGNCNQQCYQDNGACGQQIPDLSNYVNCTG